MKAAVLEQIGQPLSILDLDVPSLQPGQVLVKVLCTGICGSQLHEIDGLKGNPEHLPHLLGHEGCGIVQAVDNVVTTVKPGDKVVMHWRKGEGCDVGGATYDEVRSGPCTTFSEYSIVSENRITAIPHDIPNDFAALLGCALSTAVSIVENEAKPKIGDVVSVIGCGGLGLSIIFALTMRKNELWSIFGIDCVKSKRKLVEQFHLARFAGEIVAVASDIVIDTVSDISIGARYISLQKNGTSAGGFDPAKDIPRYCEMFGRGTFDGYENIITHRISLDQINEGIQLMRDGKAGRVLIEMNPQWTDTQKWEKGIRDDVARL